MGITPKTPCVFCAVAAVTTPVAYPPNELIVLTSARRPAPPEGSMPAMESTLGCLICIRITFQQHIDTWIVRSVAPRCSCANFAAFSPISARFAGSLSTSSAIRKASVKSAARSRAPSDSAFFTIKSKLKMLGPTSREARWRKAQSHFDSRNSRNCRP